MEPARGRCSPTLCLDRPPEDSSLLQRAGARIDLRRERKFVEHRATVPHRLRQHECLLDAPTSLLEAAELERQRGRTRPDAREPPAKAGGLGEPAGLVEERERT